MRMNDDISNSIQGEWLRLNGFLLTAFEGDQGFNIVFRDFVFAFYNLKHTTNHLGGYGDFFFGAGEFYAPAPCIEFGFRKGIIQGSYVTVVQSE